MSLQLMNFQVEAVNKLTSEPEGLIGDDMGLGKTVEAIAIDKEKRALYAKDFKGKVMTLVIAPLSVFGSWQEHFAQWRPDLKVVTLDRKLRIKFENAVTKGTGDVFICHWEALRLMPSLRSVHWFHIIADEVHRAKNRTAQQTIALKRLSTAHKLGLSGTPADNRPDDFWSVLNWVKPNTFTSYNKFYGRYVLWKQHTQNNCTATDCYAFHKRSYREILGCAETEELHRAIESFYVRRLKEEVWHDMPEKYYSKIYVELSPQQMRVYKEMSKDMLAWVGKHEHEPVAAPVVIAKLVRLQQFACAYGQLVQVKKRTEDGDIQWVDKLQLTDPSSKLDAAMELIVDNPGMQIGFFAQSRQVIELFEQRLAKAGIPAAILTGNTPQAERTKIIAEFQAGKRRIFAGTYAAGGVGITLTAASTVVRIDRPWSPSVDRQAVDRFHRIGQKNAVHIIDLVANDTIDAERIERVELKWEWIKQILGDKR